MGYSLRELKKKNKALEEDINLKEGYVRELLNSDTSDGRYKEIRNLAVPPEIKNSIRSKEKTMWYLQGEAQKLKDEYDSNSQEIKRIRKLRRKKRQSQINYTRNRPRIPAKNRNPSFVIRRNGLRARG